MRLMEVCPAPVPGPGNFKVVFINTGFGVDDTNAIVGHMHGVSLRLPRVSPLLNLWS